MSQYLVQTQTLIRNVQAVKKEVVTSRPFYEKLVFMLSLAIQLITTMGLIVENVAIRSEILFFIAAFSPAFVVYMVENKKSVLKFAVVSTLVLPAIMTLLILNTTFISYLISSMNRNIIAEAYLAVDLMTAYWQTIFFVITPALFLGMGARYLKTRSQTA